MTALWTKEGSATALAASPAEWTSPLTASGRAAELAGMSRLEFLQSLSRYKVFPLEAELSDLEQAHG